MTKEKKEHSEKCCENVWMYVSVALGIAFIIALVFAILGTAKANTGVGTDNAAKIVSDLMKKTQGIDANIVNAVEVNGLYKITLNAQGQTADIYVTLDGQNIMPGNAVFSVKDIENTPKQEDTNVTVPTVYNLPSVNAPSRGNANSKITVLEFSDYQCPFCGMVFGSPWTEKFATQYGPMIGTVKKVEALAKDNKILFKQYPVAINTQGGSTESVDASNASLCTEDQNKYWEMHDLLFSAQDSEKEYTGKFAKTNLKELGAKIEGLDLIKFNECVDKDTHVQEVKDMTTNVATAAYSNTNNFGTPTIYIVVDASVGKAKIDAITKPLAEKSKAQQPDGLYYTYAPTQDGSKYVIIADPVFANIETVINGLA